MYTGANDPHVNFGKASSFKTAGVNDGSQKTFDIQLVNTSSADVELVLYPSRYTPNVGAAVNNVVSKNGFIPHTSGATNVEATGTPNDISMLQEFLKNPTLIEKHRLTSDKPLEQFETKLRIRTYDPFGSFKDEFVDIASAKDLYVRDDKTIGLSVKIEKRSNVEVSMKLVANSRLKITSYIGASLDSDQLFAAKRAVALANDPY